jgi:hypothetical protein
MSISSILAFVIAGAAAFKGKRDRAEESPTRKSYKALLAELSEARGEAERQYEANAGLIARIAELEGDVHRANVQFRRDQGLIDVWRTRALFAEAPPGAIRPLGPAGPDFRPPQIAQQQAQMLQAQALQQQAYANQANQGLAQQYNNAQQNYANGLGAMGLLGAQSLIDAELFCNCVPSRSQVWATSDPE